MKLYIVRHGQTDLNVKQVLAGHLPAVLTDVGLSQADLLGQRFKAEQIDAIYSSDLLRSRQTTEAILKYVQCEVVYDERLRERTWGAFDSCSVSEYRKLLDESPIEYRYFKTEGGECIEDLILRSKHFLDELKEIRGEGTFLISAHHTLNKALLFNLGAFSWEDWPNFHQENTCVNEVSLNADGTWNVVKINCTTHLNT